MSRTLGSIAASTALLAGLAVAGASPAAADGHKCAKAYSGVSTASVDFCWFWYNTDHGTYNIKIEATLNDSKSGDGKVRLEVNFGSGWQTGIQAAGDLAWGEKVTKTYFDKSTVYFQACVLNQCGPDVH